MEWETLPFMICALLNPTFNCNSSTFDFGDHASPDNSFLNKGINFIQIYAGDAAARDLLYLSGDLKHRS